MNKKNRLKLISISSDYILSFCAEHPIIWYPLSNFGQDGSVYRRTREWQQTARRRGGVGDKKTPTPAVGVFLDLLIKRDGVLFTQEQYAQYTKKIWNDWLEELTTDERLGIYVRLYAQFYPAMIDSLHVWSILSEERVADVCFLDSFNDVVAKTDLTLIKGEQSVKIALRSGGASGRRTAEYKIARRKGGCEPPDCFPVWLDMDERQGIGRKRWYKLSDFADVIAYLQTIP
jgi:hypothetical protein